MWRSLSWSTAGRGQPTPGWLRGLPSQPTADWRNFIAAESSEESVPVSTFTPGEKELRACAIAPVSSQQKARLLTAYPKKMASSSRPTAHVKAAGSTGMAQSSCLVPDAGFLYIESIRRSYDPNAFVAHWNRLRWSDLGMETVRDDVAGVLCVAAIGDDEEALVPDWNRRMIAVDELMVRVGDSITAVNGIEGDAGRMQLELRTAKFLEVVVSQRPRQIRKGGSTEEPRPKARRR